jgi:hypothetical protein
VRSSTPPSAPSAGGSWTRSPSSRTSCSSSRPPPSRRSGSSSRVVEAIAPAAPARARPRRRRVRFAPTLVAAAAAAAVTTVALQLGTDGDRRLAGHYRSVLAEAHGSYLGAVRLHAARGREGGVLFVYRGRASWLMVTVDAALRARGRPRRGPRPPRAEAPFRVGAAQRRDVGGRGRPGGRRLGARARSGRASAPERAAVVTSRGRSTPRRPRRPPSSREGRAP